MPARVGRHTRLALLLSLAGLAISLAVAWFSYHGRTELCYEPGTTSLVALIGWLIGLISCLAWLIVLAAIVERRAQNLRVPAVVAIVGAVGIPIIVVWLIAVGSLSDDADLGDAGFGCDHASIGSEPAPSVSDTGGTSHLHRTAR